MVRCIKCGANIPEWSLYCPICGTLQEIEKPKIVFDTTHYETLRYNKHLPFIAEKMLGFDVQILRGSWKEHCFEKMDVFREVTGIVLGGVENWSLMSRGEEENLTRFVAEGGNLFITPGSLLYMEHFLAGLNRFISRFGLIFGDEAIRDDYHFDGWHNDHVIIDAFAIHPITEDVKTICFGDYGGLPLLIFRNEVRALAITDADAKPPHHPVLAIAPYGRGYVIVFSCSTTFEKDKYDNLRLARNILKFMDCRGKAGGFRLMGYVQSTSEEEEEEQPPPPPPPPPPE